MKINEVFDSESASASFSPSLYANPRERDRAIFRAGAEYQRQADLASVEAVAWILGTMFVTSKGFTAQRMTSQHGSLKRSKRQD